MSHCPFCKDNPSYHGEEARRITRIFDSGELDAYTDDGPVKTILRERIQQERQRHHVAQQEQP